MAKNNRIPVKWVRDRAKAAYNKEETCCICGTSADLELHHTHSITILLTEWASRKKYDITTDDGILAVRDEFISEHNKELYEDVFTLCNKHHIALHGVYGKAPPNSSAPRQGLWIEKQRAKLSGEVVEKKSMSTFAQFY